MYLSILSGLEMIQNLRDMREIDAGNIEIEKSEVDIVQVLQKSIRTFSKQCELKKISIKSDLAISEPIVSTDEYYIQRIIENLLSNAIKFSKHGKDVLLNVTKSSHEIEISVQDFGAGIKPEEEHMLYQKFKKLSSIASGGEGSLGLGLHNTLYFLKRLDGKLTLKRTNDQGSTFIIQIPAS